MLFKTQLLLLAALLGFAGLHPPQTVDAKHTESAETRLAQLVEANIIAVHAFQVLLAKSSRKGQSCFSTGELSDAALNALSEHQAKLLKSDLKQIKLWINGRESTFNPAVDLEPILSSGLKIPDNAPVNVFTRYLRQNTKASDVKIRAVASLYQTVLEVERDGGRLQEEFAFYIGLGLPVYVGQFNLPGTDADLLTAGRRLEGQSCEAPVGTSAAEWQIAGRKIWNWGEKNLHIRDERVLAAEAGIEVIEVGSILANSPQRSKFICLDGIHMTEPYHRLMAKEWLKYLAGDKVPY